MEWGGDEMEKTVYLMRHGETLFNLQKRVQGWCDSPLTDKGKEQAIAVGRYFREKGIVFDSAYSSTQERATDTLQLVTEAPFQQVKGLKEMSFGLFEGREEELLPKHRPGATSFEDALVPFGGEDIREVGQRMKETITSLAAIDPSDCLLMVSHGAAIWGLIQVAGVAFPQGIGLPNCAIFRLKVSDEKIVFEELINPQDHFRAYSLIS